MNKGGFNELALFAGGGGSILAGKLLGWNTVGAVEIEEFPRSLLLQRQKDGALPFFPIWDDIKTFKGEPWAGVVDVISAGFPCQDISSQNPKAAGIDGDRSSLFFEALRICEEIRPQFFFLENSPALSFRGLGTVLGCISEIGYNAAWCVLSASDTGALHQRNRIWILAHSDCKPIWIDGRGQEVKPKSNGNKKPLGHPHGRGLEEQWKCKQIQPENFGFEWASRWPPEPAVRRVAHGVANRVDSLKTLGNGQVPRVAALAFLHLRSILMGSYQ